MLMDTAFSGLQLTMRGLVYPNAQLACWPCANVTVCEGPAVRCRDVGAS